MNTLSEELKNLARVAGLCDEHYNAWDSGWDETTLVEYYLHNPTWCMEKAFPSVAVLKKYFDRDEIRQRGIYVDAAVTTRTNLNKYMLTGCKAGMLIDNVCSLYLRDTTAKIIVDNGGKCQVNVFGNSEVSVETRGCGKAFVYQYGENKPEMKGNIKYYKK